MTISDRRDVLKGALLAATAAVPVAVPLMARPAAAAGPARDPLKPEPVPEQVPVTEGFVEVPGGRLWYWDTGGTGSPVVLLHPGTGSALAWPYQQPVLARGGHRVVAYSRRGHYRSSPATPEDQPPWPTCSRWPTTSTWAGSISSGRRSAASSPRTSRSPIPAAAQPRPGQQPDRDPGDRVPGRAQATAAAGSRRSAAFLPGTGAVLPRDQPARRARVGGDRGTRGLGRRVRSRS